MENKEYTPEFITQLNPNEIFVFGSNLGGQHAGGAARVARQKFGAIPGRGVGLQGQSYAIPTMQGGVDTIRPYVDDFIEFARNHPHLKFYVTRIGCGIAGFKDQEIAPLFDKAFDLDNVVLPETFANIINHARRLASETEGMQFHSTPIEFYPEDLEKAKDMGHKEKMRFFMDLRKQKRYKVLHDSPSAIQSYPVLNCRADGSHVIAITNQTYAVAVGNKLYSPLYSWGLEMPCKIVSVSGNYEIPIDFNTYNDQFIVLLEDGTIREVWSDLDIHLLSLEKKFVGLATGYGDLAFGLRSDGTVAVVSGEPDEYLLRELETWRDIVQIDAGPRHLVGLKKDGTVCCVGKKSAARYLSEWKDITKIYVSKVSPLYGKTNDLTFGIDFKGWLHVGGDLWEKGEEFWKRIRAQYDVVDVLEDGYAVWVRLHDGSIRVITYYSPMDYREDIDFVRKYGKDIRYMDCYGNLMVIVDKDGEFRVLNKGIFKEVRWWNLNLPE